MPDRLTCPLAIALAWFVSLAPVEAGEALTFEKDVRPIFKAYCLDCHGGGRGAEGQARPAAEAVRRTRGRQRPGGGRGSARGELAPRAAQGRGNAAGGEEGARRNRSP